MACKLYEKNQKNLKFTMLIGNIVQNEVQTIKQINLKSIIPTLVENIKVKLFINFKLFFSNFILLRII